MISFQVTDELLRREDGAEFDVAVLLNDVESLAGFEVERLTNFLWDNDLVFGRQKRCCHTFLNMGDIEISATELFKA